MNIVGTNATSIRAALKDILEDMNNYKDTNCSGNIHNPEIQYDWYFALVDDNHTPFKPIPANAKAPDVL